MEYTERIIAFFDGSDLKLVHCSQEVKNNLQVKTENGKQFRIPMKNVIVPLHNSTFDKFSATHDELAGQITSMREEIDTELLWEMILEEDAKDFSLEDLADHYFGEQEELPKCALFSCVIADGIHFKRKGISFIPRSAEQVKEQLLAIQRKQEKEEYRSRLLPWLETSLKAQEVSDIPEEFKAFLNLLHVFLFNRKPNEASKTLNQLIGDRSLKDMTYDLLMKCNFLDKDCDRFLVIAGIEEKFSQRVQDNAAEIKAIPQHDEHRLEMDDLVSFSIDDEETKDIDDALSFETLESGLRRVGIHITDLSAYVSDGDVLDDEASKRVTSIYLPTRTVNMFPRRLSQGLASLVAGEQRPCMSFFVDFNEEGEIVEWDIKLTKLAVSHRLSYDGADAMMQDNTADLQSVLNELNDISLSLRDQRLDKGAALFNRPELKIRVFDGEPSVKLVERNSPSRSLVGEFMILANCVAALYCVRNEVPIIYRTQDVAEGLPELDPDHYDPILFDKAIKCMKKSRLSLHPGSHGGLGADFYTQLTSPIRRYTDLVMQRQLTSHLLGAELSYEAEELMSIIASAEAVGNEVKDVQRQADNYWLHEFLKKEMTGSEVEATICSKAPGGYQVELAPLHVRSRLMTPEKFSAGDKVQVRIEKVRSKGGVIQMSLIGSSS